jgi:hypothetical protein
MMSAFFPPLTIEERTAQALESIAISLNEIRDHLVLPHHDARRAQFEEEKSAIQAQATRRTGQLVAGFYEGV